MKKILNFTGLFFMLFSCLSFFSCKEKKAASYEGYDVIVDENQLELIRIPGVLDLDGNLSKDYYLQYPLSLYKAEEDVLLQLASFYNDYDGIDLSQANKIKNMFADLREGSINNFVTEENELEKVEDWYRDLRAKMYDSAENETMWNYFVNFQNLIYDSTKNITQLLLDVDEFKNGESWFDSLDELFEFNKEESNKTIRKVIKLFPNVHFISELSQKGTTPEVNNFPEEESQPTEEEYSAESFEESFEDYSDY